MTIRRHLGKCIFLTAVVLLSGLGAYRYWRGLVRPYFSWLIERDDFNVGAKVVHEDKEWYLVYKLTDEKMAQMLKDDFRSENYTGWERFNGRRTLWWDQDVINGEEHEVWINRHCEATENNMICMFLEIDRRYLVLFYGRTN